MKTEDKFVKKIYVPKRNYNGTKDDNQLIRGNAVQQRTTALPEVSEESSHIVTNHINYNKTKPAYQTPIKGDHHEQHVLTDYSFSSEE